MNHWMHELATHFNAYRKQYPDDKLMILFDIDGTILDMRYMMLYLFQKYDQERGKKIFKDLKLEEVDIHENQLSEFFERRKLAEDDRKDFLHWYEDNRWVPSAVMQSHRPFAGVLEVIRWFQIQPNTVVGLNTGRPEFLREDTLRSLNTLGLEYRVDFASQLLYMNPHDWDHDVTRSKRAGIEFFRRQGYRVIAFIDNEPSNLKAVSEVSHAEEILLLHADTLFESPLHQRPTRSVVGKDYDLVQLIGETELPKHVQLVWNRIDEASNLRQFLGSNITWGEIEWPAGGAGMGNLIHAVKRFGKSLKVRLNEGGAELSDAIDRIDDWRIPSDRLWFHAPVESVGEDGIRELAAAFPRAALETPVDSLIPMLHSNADQAKRVLNRFRQWGIQKFSMNWQENQLAKLIDTLQNWNWELHLQGIHDLESFLQAILLLPSSITADFNFLEWRKFGIDKAKIIHDNRLHASMVDY